MSDESSVHNDSDPEEGLDSLADIKKNVLDKHARKQTQARKSKSSAMTEIRSESQRMLRESVVGLPYFKPKQKSLEEFLNRKKGTPEVVQSLRLAHFSPQDDVLLQKRQKQLEEFYKKGVDDGDDDGDHDYLDDKKCGVQLANEEMDISDKGNILNVGEDKDGIDAEIDGDVEGPKESVNCFEKTPTEGENEHEHSPSVAAEQPCNVVSIEVSSEEHKIAEDNEMTESLQLVMEDTPDLTATTADDVTMVESSQAVAPKSESRLGSKMAAIKCRLADPSLEQSLNITPRLGSGSMDNDDFFSPSGPSMSNGAQKLFQRFVTHARAKGPPVHLAAAVNKPIESLNIITKQVNSDGVEVLGKETVLYNRGKGVRGNNKINYGTLKDKLRMEMLEKRREERKRREEILKLNNEEYGDELPDEEEVLEEFEADDEECSDEESGETESEPEENDVVVKDKKSRKNLFVDDEAEESAEENEEQEEEDSDDSLHLTQEDEDEDGGDSVAEEKRSAIKKLKASYRKIRAADLLSEDYNTSSPQETPLARTPVAAEDVTPLAEPAGGCGSLPFSNLSSASSSMMNTEPRWTPFTDRQDSTAAAGHSERMRTPSAGGPGDQDSPTSSQLARKRLGFEGMIN